MRPKQLYQKCTIAMHSMVEPESGKVFATIVAVTPESSASANSATWASTYALAVWDTGSVLSTATDLPCAQPTRKERGACKPNATFDGSLGDRSGCLAESVHAPRRAESVEPLKRADALRFAWGAGQATVAEFDDPANGPDH